MKRKGNVPKLSFLRSSRAYWLKRYRVREKKLARARAQSDAAGVALWTKRAHYAHRVVAKRDAQIRDAETPLRIKAYRVARTLVGVMEQGGNNSGPMVSTIIREDGGTGPEPWCGDTMAYCYRHAGSKVVTRAWASVAAIFGLLTGMVRTSSPETGMLVVYTFDHVGMFVKDNGNGTITTIEGNTGAVGAVSDSATGGDGVYVKVRSKSLVRGYVNVTR